MLLCLSSGHSRRYREDVLRSAGLPTGAVVQFRYDDKHLGPGVKTLIATSTIVGHQVLIAYSDQSAKGRDPEMIPCRFGSIASFEKVGTTVSVKLQLGHFAFSENISAFNTELQQLSARLIPRREGDKLTGCYFLELNAEPRALARTADNGNWQKLVDQLADRDDFRGYETFLLVRELRRPSGEAVGANDGGQLVIEPGRRYVLKLYQYHPTKIPSATRIEVTSGNPRIQFLTDSTLSLDSRYDHKEIAFTATLAVDAAEPLIKIVQKHNSTDDLTVDFGLPLVISSGWLLGIGYALVITLLLSAPHVASALASSTLTQNKLIGVLVVAVTSSACAALFAVFKVRRIL